MSVPPPTSVAEWVAQRRAAGLQPAHLSRESLKKLNVRGGIPAETHAFQPDNHSTERLHVPAPPVILNHMVERLDATFTALADPTRRAMLAQLVAGERSVGELAAPHAMSFAGAAKHVGVLERAGLVERRREGRRQLCRLRAAPLAEANAWLRQWENFWNARLDALEVALKDHDGRADDGR